MSRRYLPEGHRLRERVVSAHLQYPTAELAGPPKLKNTVFVHTAALQALNGGYEHYLGQKGHPMLSGLINYSYEDMMIFDWMHGLSGLFKWAMKIVVGPYGDKSVGRAVKNVWLLRQKNGGSVSKMVFSLICGRTRQFTWMTRRQKYSVIWTQMSSSMRVPRGVKDGGKFVAKRFLQVCMHI